MTRKLQKVPERDGKRNLLPIKKKTSTKFLRNEDIMTTKSPKGQHTTPTSQRPPVANMSPATILSPPSPHDIRDELTDMVIRDLLGPAGGSDEELDQREDRVRERYLVGALAPKAVSVDAGTLDELGSSEQDDAEVGPTDLSTTASDTMFPSSIGMSFVADSGAREILIKSQWGRYYRTESSLQKKRDGTPALVWQRKNVIGVPQLISLKDGGFGPIPTASEQPLVVVQGRIRHTVEGWIITVFLINQQEQQKQRKDEAWVFQPKIIVLAPDEAPIFIKRKRFSTDLSKMDPITREETETLEMLYRQHLEFAVGHGVSVHVTIPTPFVDKATQIETEFMPEQEVAQQTPPAADDPGFDTLRGLSLDMKDLAELPTADLITNLRIIEAAYADWISSEQAKPDNPAEKLSDHEESAMRAILRCRRTLDRISEGIDLIEKNLQAEEAFRFANRAMWHQRIRSTYARMVRKKELEQDEGTDTCDLPGNRSWRLFQIAFILLNLPSVTNLHHPDRSHETDAVADLLWFATGGGKTEAYLGLTAYVLALRRLQGDIEGCPGDHGMAVLM
ncbi:MAG: hypothetical protein WCO89_09500, partial [Syntrophus sp. (in: bacteria)]